MSNTVSTALRSFRIPGRRVVAKAQRASVERESKKRSARPSFWDLDATSDRYPDRLTTELARIWAANRQI
jgi:hypothetical protein